MASGVLRRLRTRPYFSTATGWKSLQNISEDLDKLETVAQYFENHRGQPRAPAVFDRELKLLHRSRSAELLPMDEPLITSLAASLIDRTLDARRKFSRAVVIGGQGKFVAREFLKVDSGAEAITFIDPSQKMLDEIKGIEDEHRALSKSVPNIDYILGDEEAIPLPRESADLVISCMGMHWINDLPGALVQYLHLLKPDGLFLANMLGGNTLQELRIAFSLAEQEREGGVSPRVSPLVKVIDAGSLLSGAGFNLIGVDVDDITVKYKNAWELMDHLSLLGESGASLQRRETMKRDVALAVAAVYEGMFGEDGYIPATFQVLNLTGWAPDPSQQKPARRGSATVSLDDLDKAAEEMEIKYIDVEK